MHGRYAIGIVDVLSEWSLQRRLQRWAKTVLKRLDPDGVSEMRPPDYYRRFKRKLQELLLPQGFGKLQPPTARSPVPRSPEHPWAGEYDRSSPQRNPPGEPLSPVNLPRPQLGTTAMTVEAGGGAHFLPASPESSDAAASPRRLREDNYTMDDDDDEDSPRLTGMPLQDM